MADKNFCVKHQQVWFKKGAMKGYAHPIKDADGVVLEWCNKPKEAEDIEQMREQISKLPRGTVDMSAMEKSAEGDKPLERRIMPEELGMWWKQVGDRIGDGSIERDFPRTAVKIKTQYYHRMADVTGVKFKD